MQKYSISKFLFEFANDEPEDDPRQEVKVNGQAQQSQPQPQQQEQPAQLPGKTPQENKGAQPENRQAFSDILGSTLSDISFSPLGGKGGELKIMTSTSQNPLVISWIGQTVDVVQPDGTKIRLS